MTKNVKTALVVAVVGLGAYLLLKKPDWELEISDFETAGIPVPWWEQILGGRYPSEWPTLTGEWQG